MMRNRRAPSKRWNGRPALAASVTHLYALAACVRGLAAASHGLPPAAHGLAAPTAHGLATTEPGRSHAPTQAAKTTLFAAGTKGDIREKRHGWRLFSNKKEARDVRYACLFRLV